MRESTNPIRRPALLKARLDDLVATFDLTSLSPDPLELVRAYSDPLDQEVSGLLAAAFAYGRAEIVVANVGAVLRKMLPSPYRYFSEGHFTADDAAVRFGSFTHRFHKSPHLIGLFERIGRAIELEGSLGALFRRGYLPDEADIGPALSRFVATLIEVELPGEKASTTAGLRYLLSSPADGSACKRMNLYLRWMVRRESPDLGLWDFVDPAKLVMPLDTHVHRITTFLGLNVRRTADWTAARLLTDKLARFHPADPVRYDFAICRLGVLDLCSRKKRKENCDVCLLREVCRFPVKR